jgi:hypothetical protein
MYHLGITRALTGAANDEWHLRVYIQRCFCQSTTITHHDDWPDNTLADWQNIKLRLRGVTKLIRQTYQGKLVLRNTYAELGRILKIECKRLTTARHIQGGPAVVLSQYMTG